MDLTCILYKDRCSFYYRLSGGEFALLYVEGEECTQVNQFTEPQWHRLIKRVRGSLGLGEKPSTELHCALIAGKDDGAALEALKKACSQHMGELVTQSFEDWLRQELPPDKWVKLAFHEHLWRCKVQSGRVQINQAKPYVVARANGEVVLLTQLLNEWKPGPTSQSHIPSAQDEKKKNEQPETPKIVEETKTIPSADASRTEASGRLRSALQQNISRLSTHDE